MVTDIFQRHRIISFWIYGISLIHSYDKADYNFIYTSLYTIFLQNIRICSKKGVSKENMIFMYIFVIYTINLSLSQLQDDINTYYRINLFSYPSYNYYCRQKQNYDQTNSQSNKRTTNCITHKTSLCPGYNKIFIFGFVTLVLEVPLWFFLSPETSFQPPKK